MESLQGQDKKKYSIGSKDQQELVSRGSENAEYFNSFYFLRNILDNIQIGIIISDSSGYLIYINEKYGELLSINPEEHIGKHVTEVISTSRLHIVAQTGRPEINWPHELNEQTFLVQRIPLKKDGRVIAVLGTVLFNDPGEVSKLADQLIKLESKLKVYEHKLSSVLSTRYTIDNIVGVSSTITQLKETAANAMANDLPVLITGESGTGKELFAQAIHEGSSRRLYPFVQFNCAAIPRELFESELFGYEKGAFTGAHPKGKIGKFELADQGTIFLDEIAELPFEMQAKLLRVLETKQFERVGGNALVKSDFRIIAATNCDLKKLLEEGMFRSDLYYRLNVIPIHIPPLRERKEDIIPIAGDILRQHQKKKSARQIGISREAGRYLTAYSWPGNVRELTNVLERILCSLKDKNIQPRDLPLNIKHDEPFPQRGESSLRESMQSAEKRAIEKALEECGNNKSRAARMLGIHRSLLYKKIDKLGISEKDIGQK